MPSSNFSPDSLPDLHGKVYLVTGGNAGIGKATVAGLAAHGARVYMGARSESKAASSIEDVKKQVPDADIRYLGMDLARLESVVAAARELREKEPKLHGLINNAGIMGVPFEMTADGFESQFQTNYLSHWLLTHHLLPLLESTAKSEKPGDVRIINVTSDGHGIFATKEGIRFDDIELKSESAMTRYGQSKLANILHAKELNRRFGPRESESGPQPGEIWVAAVHPGHIATDLNRQATAMAPPIVLRIMFPVMKCLGVLDEQAKGALSSLWAVASPGFSRENSGAYVVPYAKIGKPSAQAEDGQLAERLWTWTEEALSKKQLL